MYAAASSLLGWQEYSNLKVHGSWGVVVLVELPSCNSNRLARGTFGTRCGTRRSAGGARRRNGPYQQQMFACSPNMHAH